MAGAEKLEKSDPLFAMNGNIPERLADFGKSTQVMMFLHQVVVTLLFRWQYGTDKNFRQVKQKLPPSMNDYTIAYILHEEGLVQLFLNLYAAIE